jgi:tRNA(fMet)-specific endonuclease VapC
LYLIDTDILSHVIRGDRDVLERFEEHGSSIMLVSVMTLHEIRYGLRRIEHGRADLEACLAGILEILIPVAIDCRIAEEAALIRASLDSTGRPVGLADPLIAATARVHGLTIVTHNTKHFAEIDGLDIEDWKA